jgi:hypothetical protein
MANREAGQAICKKQSINQADNAKSVGAALAVPQLIAKRAITPT